MRKQTDLPPSREHFFIFFAAAERYSSCTFVAHRSIVVAHVALVLRVPTPADRYEGYLIL